MNLSEGLIGIVVIIGAIVKIAVVVALVVLMAYAIKADDWTQAVFWLLAFAIAGNTGKADQ